MSSGQRKKILFVITKSVWGGAQKYVYDIATHLPGDRYEPIVALGGDGPLAQKLKKASISVYHIRNFQRSINPLKDLFAYAELVRLIWHTRPAIVHANSSKAGGLAGLAAWSCQLLGRAPLRIIFTAHGWAFHESRPRWQIAIIKASSKLTSALADTVITVSDYDRSAAMYLKIAPEHKLITIHSGLAATAFLERSEAQKELLGTKKQFLIGTLAEWTSNKGLSFLLKAVPHIIRQEPQAVFCLIGWGEEEKALREQAHTLGIEKYVYFINGKPEAARYLKAFDIFVLPSLKEGLPYTILEAGAAGLPVIATRVGGIPEIIQDNYNGLLISPASETELARAIVRLTKNNEERQHLAATLQKTIEHKFQFTTFIKETLRVYEL
jgi:glycosyltransferase involved in cell wall biosynthesis